jgi:hypothetical protein
MANDAIWESSLSGNKLDSTKLILPGRGIDDIALGLMLHWPIVVFLLIHAKLWKNECYMHEKLICGYLP